MNRREESVGHVLKKHGFRFSKALGQNFLTDKGILDRIADSAELSKDIHVLEIGPGIGVLTRRLCDRAGFVTSVELDKALLTILDETLEGYDNCEIINGDILETDVVSLMKKRNFNNFAVCANLPYNITGPAVGMLLEAEIFQSLTLMVQREVAKRMAAQPGTPEYGAFTVLINYYGDATRLFDVQPGSFMPPPKVTSSVVRIVTKKPPEMVKNSKVFFKIVKAAFGQRRKTLANALLPICSDISKAEIGDIMHQVGLDPMARGETLGIAEFAALALKLENWIK